MLTDICPPLPIFFQLGMFRFSVSFQQEYYGHAAKAKPRRAKKKRMPARGQSGRTETTPVAAVDEESGMRHGLPTTESRMLTFNHHMSTLTRPRPFDSTRSFLTASVGPGYASSREHVRTRPLIASPKGVIGSTRSGTGLSFISEV